MQPLELTVRIEPDLPEVVDKAVSFETGASREQAADPRLFVYEHHTNGFSLNEPGALVYFFEDLILGRSMPLVFATKALNDIDTVVAITLFLQRDLALHPALPGFVSMVDFVHRRGLPALSHIEPDLARFLCFLRGYLPEIGLSKRQLGERLTQAVTWIREYVMDGSLPHLGVEPTPVRVIDQGSSGFVLAETAGSLVDGWVDIFRQGFLRGLLVGPDQDGRKRMLGARKSSFVSFDLLLAAHLLNQMETAMGELPEWKSDGMWLESPPSGTLILTSHVLEVLVRV